MMKESTLSKCISTVLIVGMTWSFAVIASAQVTPDVLYTPHEYWYGNTQGFAATGPGIYHQPGNLLTEGTSFEVGSTGALDGGWAWMERRSNVWWREANYGSLPEEFWTHHKPPTVENDPNAPHGDRVLKISTENRSAYKLYSRPFQVPAIEDYLASLYVKFTAGERASFGLKIIDTETGNMKAQSSSSGIQPDEWERIFTAEAELDPDNWYHVEINIGDWFYGDYYPDQYIWIDAVQVEATSSMLVDYVHPTSLFQLGAHTCYADSLTDRVLYDTFWLEEQPQSDRCLSVQVFNPNPPPTPELSLTVNLYDSTGNPANPASPNILATTTLGVSPGDNVVNLESLLTQAGNAPGFYLAELLLKHHQGTTIIDRQEVPFLVLHKAEPFNFDDHADRIEASPFGGHAHLIRWSYLFEYNNIDYWDFWYSLGLDTNAAPRQILTYMRDLGIRWTREFNLFDYNLFQYCYSGTLPAVLNFHSYWDQPNDENLTYSTSLTPYFQEYVNELYNLGMKVLPVFWFGPTPVLSSQWPTDDYTKPEGNCFKSYISEMIDEHSETGSLSSAFDCGELFNELLRKYDGQNPKMSLGNYAKYVLSAYSEFSKLTLRPEFRLAGPADVANYFFPKGLKGYEPDGYLNTLLAIEESNGLHVNEMLDIVTFHEYLKSNDNYPNNYAQPEERVNTGRSPEDLYNNQEGNDKPRGAELDMIYMSGNEPPVYSVRQEPLVNSEDLPVWISEWGPFIPLARSDQPYIGDKHSVCDEFGEPYEHRFCGGMCGSLLLGRRMSARAVKMHLCGFEHNMEKLFSFSTLPGQRGAGWRWFEGDMTPTVLPGAMSFLMHTLEGFDFDSAVPANVFPSYESDPNPYYTRIQLYTERNPVDPDDPRTVAVLWNRADDEFDHEQGAEWADDYDPAPLAADTVIDLNLDPTSEVEVFDLMGRPLDLSGTTIDDLTLNHEPIYIVTRPGFCYSQLRIALDNTYLNPPPPPPAPKATKISANQANITINGYNPEYVGMYICYRVNTATQVETFVGQSVTLPFIDKVPGGGSYYWKMKILDKYLVNMSEFSPPSNIITFNQGVPK